MNNTNMHTEIIVKAVIGQLVVKINFTYPREKEPMPDSVTAWPKAIATMAKKKKIPEIARQKAFTAPMITNALTKYFLKELNLLIFTRFFGLFLNNFT